MALVKREYVHEETPITAENLNDIQDAIIELEDGLFALDNDSSGEAVTISDAANRGFRSLKIYGKTTQDGTPTLEAPVDLVSSADGDSISVHVCGKNLFTGWIVGGVNADSGITHTIATYRRTGYIPILSPGQRYSISNTPDTLYNFTAFYDGEKKFISRTPATPTSNRRVDPPVNARYLIFNIYENPQLGGKISEADAMANVTMIEAGSTATEYERGKQIQTATITGLDGLRGFPVYSGGNHTDANGQQWICDEIDLDRGVYVKRIGQVTLDGSESWLGYLVTEVNQFHVAIPSIHQPNERGAMCKYYKPITLSERNLNYGTIYTYNGGVAINTQECANVTEWKALLANRPITVLYVLDIPVETPLQAEDLAAYAKLHTNKERTTVCNSGHAYMELEYAMDAKKYIDRLAFPDSAPAAKIGTVTLLASAWAGTDNLHSQVVNIEGVTPYSKVDLLPSVEQLAIFQNKNVTFVTENEGGVVTVYAIGDKPTQNYTMQVQITEVLV